MKILAIISMIPFSIFISFVLYIAIEQILIDEKIRKDAIIMAGIFTITILFAWGLNYLITGTR